MNGTSTVFRNNFIKAVFWRDKNSPEGILQVVNWELKQIIVYTLNKKLPTFINYKIIKTGSLAIMAQRAAKGSKNTLDP